MIILRRTAFLSVLVAAAVLFSGCARYPSTPPQTGRQLVLTVRVAGTINPIDDIDPGRQRYYFIAIDNDGDENTGPWALETYGSNGWVTSEFADQGLGMTSFVEYSVAYQDTGIVYAVRTENWPLSIHSPQLPIRTEILDGGSTLRFIIDFSQIETATILADQIEQLDINFITTDNLALNLQDYLAGREWDGLGPSGKSYVTVDTTSDTFLEGDNGDGHLVSDPDLDIIYWSIEVQTVSSG